MTDHEKKRGLTCLKVLVGGCLGLLALMVLAVVVIWMSWDSILQTEWYRSLTEKAEEIQEDIGHTLALRAEVLAEYPAQEVAVNTSQIYGLEEKAWVRSLSLGFVNPAFPEPETFPSEKDAREIALFAASRYPEIERFDAIVVAFREQTSVGIEFSKTSQHRFPVPELLEELQGEPALIEETTLEAATPQD